jgi:L-threonylcarbamoyladenylate synthase
LEKDNIITTEIIKKAVEILKRGGVIAFPTETVYGLGASIAYPEAARRIYDIKGRDFKKALPLVLSDVSQIDTVAVSIPEASRFLIDKFWPGPLTIIVLKTGIVPDLITAGGNTVAVRVSSNPIAREIVRELGVPITGTSANLSGSPSPISADDVSTQLGTNVDLIIDGGKGSGIESTIVDVTQSPLVILREGAIKIEAIQAMGITVRKQSQENKR